MFIWHLLIMYRYWPFQSMSFSSNTSSGYSVEVSHPPSEVFNIVSLQSSARPGCIIDLEAITDAKQVGFTMSVML